MGIPKFWSMKLKVSMGGWFWILVLLVGLVRQHGGKWMHRNGVDALLNHSEGRCNTQDVGTSRRSVIARIPQQLGSWIALETLDATINNYRANALSFPGFDQGPDRRQKELCLVNLLRLQSWATRLSEKLKDESIGEDAKKTLYLEARLGSKVMVASSKKISGGATANVFMLKGLYVRECLDDLTYYADKSSRKQMNQFKEDLIESIASIVEFDGLETTQDPSPRSSLTLTMFNAQKSLYVQRMLSERIVPLIDDILVLFGPDARAQSEVYMKEFYPSETIARNPPSSQYTVATGADGE